MLILHGTAKFLTTLNAAPVPSPVAADADPIFGTWQATLFDVDDTPYFAFLQPRTRLPLFLPATLPFTLDTFVAHLTSLLDAVGIPDASYRPHLATLTNVTLTKSKDRKQAAALAQVLRDLHFNIVSTHVFGTCDPTTTAVHKMFWETPLRDLPSHSPLMCLRLLLDGQVLPAPPPAKPSASTKKKPTRAKRAAASKPTPAPPAPAFTLIRPDGSQTACTPSRHDKSQTLPAILAILQDAEEEDFTIEELLRDIMTVTPDPGGDLAALLASHPRDDFATDAMMLLFQSANNRAIPPGVQRTIAAGAVPALQRAMRDRAVPDPRKLMAGPLLAKFGAPIPEEEYASYFQDFEAALAAMKPDLPPLSATPFCVEKLLDCTDIPLTLEDDSIHEGDGCWDLLSSIAQECADSSPETAALIVATGAAVAIWQRAGLDDLFSEMFHGLAQSNAPHVRWQLETLACWPFAGGIGAAATEAARAMQIRGVEMQHPFFREFSHGYMGMVDGSGTRQLALFFRTPEGGMDAVVLLLRTGWGIKDAFTLYEDVNDLEETLCDSEMSLPLCPCSLPLARDLFADALSMHASSGKRVPPKAYLIRQYLGSERLLPRPRTPNLGVYMLETLRRTPELVTEYEPMLEDEPFGGLWFHSDAAYAYVRANQKSLRPHKPQASWMKSFLLEACITERDSLLHHMAINLEVEALAGRARRSVNKMAARNYLAIEEEVVPFDTIPYVRALAERALDVILGNLQQGFRNQAEANQAALERDDKMQEMMDQLLWANPDLDEEDD